MKYIASCSFGKDSLCMVLMLIEKQKSLDEVIFYNTGVEFSCIYHIRDKVEKLLKEQGIKYTELHPDNLFLYDMLVRPVKYRKPNEKPYPFHYGYGWCGGSCRWGTAQKTLIINRYYKQKYPNEEIIEYVGIAADEAERQKDDRNKKYPLVEWGMTESDCLKYCREKGYQWLENGVDLYSILDRVSCWCCRNKNLKELKNIYTHLPNYWQMLRGLQSRIDEPFKGKGKSIFELEKKFQEE